MLLPTELLATGSAAAAKPLHRIIAIDHAGSLFWSLDAGERKFTMFLTQLDRMAIR